MGKIVQKGAPSVASAHSLLPLSTTVLSPGLSVIGLRAFMRYDVDDDVVDNDDD